MAQAIILACGNPLRGDDGVAWHIARALQETSTKPQMKIVCAQQWTPEMAEDISQAELAIFVDASAAIAAGEIRVERISVSDVALTVETHALSPMQLFSLATELYQRVPEKAFLLTIGGQSFEHGDQLSEAAHRAIPAACHRIQALLAAGNE